MGCHPTLSAAARIVAGTNTSLLDAFSKFFTRNQRRPLVDVDGNLYLWNYLRPLAEQIVRGDELVYHSVARSFVEALTHLAAKGADVRVIFDGEPLSDKLASVQRKTVRKPYLEEAKRRLAEESKNDDEVVRGAEVDGGGSDGEDSSDDSDESVGEDNDDQDVDQDVDGDGDVIMEPTAVKRITVGELSWKKLAAGAVSLTDELMCVVQLAIARAGITFLVAPNEADSQMAGGGADFRMTTDGDHFLLYYKTVSPVIVLRRLHDKRAIFVTPSAFDCEHLSPANIKDLATKKKSTFLPSFIEMLQATSTPALALHLLALCFKCDYVGQSVVKGLGPVKLLPLFTAFLRLGAAPTMPGFIAYLRGRGHVVTDLAEGQSTTAVEVIDKSVYIPLTPTGSVMARRRYDTVTQTGRLRRDDSGSDKFGEVNMKPSEIAGLASGRIRPTSREDVSARFDNNTHHKAIIPEAQPLPKNEADWDKDLMTRYLNIKAGFSLAELSSLTIAELKDCCRNARVLKRSATVVLSSSDSYKGSDGTAVSKTPLLSDSSGKVLVSFATILDKTPFIPNFPHSLLRSYVGQGSVSAGNFTEVKTFNHFAKGFRTCAYDGAFIEENLRVSRQAVTLARRKTGTTFEITYESVVPASMMPTFYRVLLVLTCAEVWDGDNLVSLDVVSITSAACQCAAGNSGNCNHVAALGVNLSEQGSITKTQRLPLWKISGAAGKVDLLLPLHQQSKVAFKSYLCGDDLSEQIASGKAPKAAMPVPPDEVAGGGQEGLAVSRGVSMNLALIQPPRQGRFF